VTEAQKQARIEVLSLPVAQNLKFEREDWTLFRTLEGLQQRAGVPARLLRRLVLKEIADNGLDSGWQSVAERLRTIRESREPQRERECKPYTGVGKNPV
jgi:hypothetical protein